MDNATTAKMLPPDLRSRKGDASSRNAVEAERFVEDTSSPRNFYLGAATDAV